MLFKFSFLNYKMGIKECFYHTVDVRIRWVGKYKNYLAWCPMIALQRSGPVLDNNFQMSLTACLPGYISNLLPWNLILFVPSFSQSKSVVSSSAAKSWTVACQAPLPRGFSRQEYWSGLHFLLQGIFPTQESNTGLLHYRQILYWLNYEGQIKLDVITSKLDTIEGISQLVDIAKYITQNVP